MSQAGREEPEVRSRARQEQEEEKEEEEGEVPCLGSIRIAELLVPAIHSLGFKVNVKYFEALAHRRAVSTAGLHWHVLLNSVFLPQRLALVCRGHLSALLLQKLICAVSCDVKHARGVMSRRYFVGLRPFVPKVNSTLQGHSDGVRSVAFHPSAPYLATGSLDNTAKLWLLNADCSAATCVSTLQGHRNIVTSVAFHPSAPYLATGSGDGTAKLWLLNTDCSAATCVSTLEGHSLGVSSVGFHPSAPYLATGSYDNTAKLWRRPAFVPNCFLHFVFTFVAINSLFKRHAPLLPAPLCTLEHTFL